MAKLFTEHFCYDEDDEGSEKASASEEIYQGVTGGGKHGMDNQCNHIHILISFVESFLFLPCCTIVGEPDGCYGVLPYQTLTLFHPAPHLRFPIQNGTYGDSDELLEQ